MTNEHARVRVPVAALWVIGLSAVALVVDLTTPVTVSTGVLFVIPLLFGISLRSERTLYVLTAIVVVALFATFSSFPAIESRVGLINRLLSVAAMIGVAFLAGRQIRTNRALQEQRQRLAHLMELQTEFVRAVSHDIRAPIGAVLGYVELLESGVASEPVTERQASMLGGITRSCRGVVALTDNLLTTAKLDSGDFPVEHAPFDLVALVTDLIAEMTSADLGGAERIHLSVPPVLIVSSDALRVRQVLLNLLSNAVKYSPPDACVEVTIGAADYRVQIAVVDAGPGIPVEEHERIFEPFYQVGDHRRHSGVGLGLPLARRIARALGGDVTLESTVGRGSKFVLELPGEGSK